MHLIVVFDVEGVLVDGEFLPELAKAVGRSGEVAEITRKGISGELDWEEGLAQRVDAVKGVTYSECRAVAEALPLMNGAEEIASRLKEMDCITVGVSGGFSLLAMRVKEALKLDHIFSNELVFHDNRLIGYGMLVNSNKTQILRSAFGSVLKGHKKVAVVDGANDIDLFGLVDLKVAFNAQRIVRERADIVIDGKDLKPLVGILDEFKVLPER